MTRQVSLAEIAESSGVSPATVSRVLNGDTRVSQERAEAVRRAVAELGYSPNRGARSLASGKTGLVAVIIDNNLTVFEDPFWALVTKGISGKLLAHGVQSLLMVTDLASYDHTVAASLSPKQIDGAIFFQVHREELLYELADQGLPIVVAGTPQRPERLIYVDSDQFGGAKEATEYLIAQGRRNIATITGDVFASAAQQRLSGYKKGLESQGLVVNPNLIVIGDYSYESGRRGMISLLDSGEKIDGLFAANDLMAVAAISVLEERGLRVPDDVSVVGFDDSQTAQISKPSLTSVHQDIEQLGIAAAELILEAIAGAEPESRIHPTYLVVRESS